MAFIQYAMQYMVSKSDGICSVYSCSMIAFVQYTWQYLSVYLMAFIQHTCNYLECIPVAIDSVYLVVFGIYVWWHLLSISCIVLSL